MNTQHVWILLYLYERAYFKQLFTIDANFFFIFYYTVEPLISDFPISDSSGKLTL